MRVPEISVQAAGRVEAWRRGPRRAKLRAVGAGVAIVFCLLAAQLSVASEKNVAQKKSGAWVHFPFDSLGIPAVSNPFLSTGSSMLTVHFLDGSHLLVTFSLRSLVPRLRGDPAGDDDRLVAAEIVDLPSGHIAARTEWHMHDHGRYLWKLNRGRFLVRIGDRLSTIAPMANLPTGDAFLRTVFPSPAIRPSVVDVSPDGGVVTLESVLDAADDGSNGSTVVLLGDKDTAKPTSQTLINFYRVADVKGGAEFAIKPAGSLLALEPVYLPVDADGYLWAQPVDDGFWKVTFDSYAGRTTDLGKVLSSCRPRLQMISRSEFLVLSCKGADDSIRIASFGLDGRETWEEGMSSFGPPTFAFAPAAGRFAMSDTGTEEPPAPAANVPPEVPHQEVRVYQNASGDLLLKVECTPVFKTAENFDLSPDGLAAVVVRDGSIAVYRLPPLTKRDETDMAEVEKFAPPVTEADVTLAKISRPATAEKIAAANAMAVEAQTSVVAGTNAAATQPAAVSAPIAAGKPSTLAIAAGAIRQASPESSQTGPRQAPTLLKPGEEPEYGPGNANPE